MRVLERRYPIRDWARGMTPFEILISTVLSQSTTVANERRGLEDLCSRIGVITPGRVADTSEADIAAAIWHAGLGRQKAPRIRRIATEILERHGGRLEEILALPTDRARAELMALPGVGPKTAGVVLSMAGDHPTFPGLTHNAPRPPRWEPSPPGEYENGPPPP